MTEIPEYVREAMSIGSAKGGDVGFMADAQAQLARALVENAGGVPSGFSAAWLLLRWEIGQEEADHIVLQILEWKLRESRGVGGRFVKALKMLAGIEERTLSILARKSE